MYKEELIPQLFHSEYRKIVAVLAKRFGMQRIELAEDIASETFLAAAETWGLKGIPENPTAWLYKVAKNKAKNQLLRNNHFENKIAPEIKNITTSDETIEVDLSPKNINDSQLQMMFAVCHPSIATEAQIGLALRILCSFGIEEIADAFLTNKETINKRLFRAKEKLKAENIQIEIPQAQELENRLSSVLTTIYLLFNEGYYSISKNVPLRKELCLEAMRLCLMLIENITTNGPSSNALMSLMCFHASRFEARQNEQGEPILYDDQDSTLWDTDLIRKGEYFLNCASTGNKISKYHLEAAIAYWHTQKADTQEKWESILQLYNKHLQLEYSPMAALNRTYALAKANGKEVAIIEAEKLKLLDNHFYYTLLGELYKGIDDEKAVENLKMALALAKTQTDKQSIQKKMDTL